MSTVTVHKPCMCLQEHIIPLKTAIENRDKEIAELKHKLSVSESHLESSRRAWDELYKIEDANEKSANR